MDEKMKRAWRARETVLIADQWERLSLTLAWLELDALLTDRIEVHCRRGGPWRASMVPAKRGAERKLTQIPLNALRVASASLSGNTFGPFAVTRAKDLLRNAMLALQQDVQA